MDTRRRSNCLAVITVAVLSLLSTFPTLANAAAPKPAKITASVLNVSALQPGKAAMAAVVVEMREGYHAQSSTPSQSYLDAFSSTLEKNPALTYGSPILPKGEDHDYGQLGVLNVYTGTVVVYVPIEVKPDAPIGPMKIAGVLHYQICDKDTCLAPEDAKFEIATEIVPATQAVERTNPERFRAVPATGPATSPSGASPPSPPRTASAARAPEALTILGFELKADAYFLAFGAAFLVGIIFNAVPCVLPVLPLKALGFYEVSQHNRGKSVAFGLAFSLGVVAAFATLGLLVVVLRVLKWGELFSNPWFAGGLVVVLVVMALNMFGLFTVNLPTGIYAFSPRHDTYFGNFLFGILTAALSTPCTFGMFVGLLTWALAHSAAVGMILMITVGAGMAFPYLVLSAFPELARRFPRTGPWASVVKELMGFLLLAVAAYFAQGWINQLTGPQAFWWVLFAIIAGAGLFLVIRSFQFGKTAVAPFVGVAVALLLVAPAFIVVRQLTIRPYTWHPYTVQALDQARSNKKVVLVEFTASWCANCHTLEGLVLNRQSVQASVSRYDVAMIKADLSDKAAPGWTLLSDLGANGVPLTAIYSPSLPEPILLTGIYNVANLQAALDRAAQSSSQTMAAR